MSESELKEKLVESIRLLNNCIGDMHDLISAAQMNLTGESINGLFDKPQTTSIGRTKIHQNGIDETKKIIKSVKQFLSEVRADQFADSSKTIK